MEFELIAEGLGFPEGPVVMADGRIVVVEVTSGIVTEVDGETGTLRPLAATGGGPNGAALGPDGELYVCNNGGLESKVVDGIRIPMFAPADYVSGSIQRIDPESGTVTTLYDSCDGRPLLAPNDLVFDDAGGFWFTDCGHTRPREMDLGGVFYAAADGSSIVEVAEPLLQPNGIGLSPDGTVLYVAETAPGRLWQWPVLSPGVLDRSGTGPGGSTLLYGFDGNQKLDSLAIDEDGNICVATLVSGAISVVSPTGELLDQWPVPVADPFVTNICFGGDDGRTAYVTSGGRGLLYRARWPRRGLPLSFGG